MPLTFDDLIPKPTAQPLSFDDLIPAAPPPDSGLPGAQDNSISGGLYRGLAGTGVGLIQTLNDLTGQKLLSPEAKAASERFASQLAHEGKGTGLSGTIEEAIGDPLNWAPWKSLLAYGATAGATAPQTNDTGIGGRIEQGAIEAPVMAVAGQAGKYLGKGIQTVANKTGLTDLVAPILQKFGQTGNPSDLYSLAKQAGLDVTGKTPQDIADSLQNWYQAQTDKLASGVSTAPYSPKAAVENITQNWDTAQKATNDAYAAAKEAGKDILQPTGNLPQKLDSMIAELQGNTAPGTKEHAALAQLKYIRQNIPDNIPAQAETTAPSTILDPAGAPLQTPVAATPAIPSQVPASDLIDLRTNLNKVYKPKQLPDSAMLPALSATQDVKAALNSAAAANPAFGDALNYADANQANLGYTYKKNELLQKFFKPEDFNALQQNAVNGTPIPDITIKRANAMLEKIKTPEDLTAVTRAMSPQMADALRAQKVKLLMDKAGMDYGTLTDPAFMSLMQSSLKNDPQALSQLNTIQQVANVLSRRGVNINSPGEIAQNGERENQAVMSLWDLFEGRHAYAIRRVYRALNGEEEKGLSALQSDINKGAPFKSSAAPALQQAVPRLLSPEMKQTTPAQTVESQQTESATTQTTPLIDRIAQAESGGNPNAQNPNSTASGPLQFTDSTWAQMVGKYGKQTGITLKDKDNPEAQATMGQLLAQDNAKYLTSKLGRAPTDGEIYAAHFLGAPDALKLIKAQGTGKQAILLFPRRVISDNRSIFFDGKQPRTVEQVYQLLANKVS